MDARAESLSESDRAKYFAAKEALKLVDDNMKIGLGTGSTAFWFVELLAERVIAEGLTIRCVPTSSRTKAQATGHGLAIHTLDELVTLDMVVDGADEMTPELDLIKGGGGALLQEKIVAAASGRMVVIGDDTKYVETLGKFLLPVEVIRFGLRSTEEAITRLMQSSDVDGHTTSLRMWEDGAPYVTDEGHYIIDIACERIGAPATLAEELNLIPGVVESGLFIGLAERLIIGRADGSARIVTKSGHEDVSAV